MSARNKRLRQYLFIGSIILVIVSLIIIDNIKWTWQLQSDQETLNVIQEIYPVASYYYFDTNEIYKVYDNNKKNIGYAFYAEGVGEAIPRGEYGYKAANPIVILVGLKDQETIKGIHVISQGETWFFWNLLVQHNYFDQFNDLKIKDACFVDNGGSVDCVTMATMSSTSVLNIVRNAVSEKAPLIN